MNLNIINENNHNDIITGISKNNPQVLIIFLDEEIDMLDKISWIWNANFQDLNTINRIFCCGKRNLDLFLKLKLDNLNNNLYLEEDVSKLLQELKEQHQNIEIISSDFSLKQLKQQIISDSIVK